MHVYQQLKVSCYSTGEDGCSGGSGQADGPAGGAGLRESGEGQNLDSAATTEGRSIVLKRGVWATACHADSPRVCLSGAGTTVRSGEEVPHLDWREESFEKQRRRCGGGEQCRENF